MSTYFFSRFMAQRNSLLKNLCFVSALLVLAIPLVWLTIKRPEFGLGAAYVILYWICAWYWPHVALMLIVALAPLQNDLSGGGGPKFSAAEINIALSIPIFYIRALTRKRRLSMGPLLVPILLYLSICIVSSLLYWHGNEAITSLVQMFLYMVISTLLFSQLIERPEQNLVSLNALVTSGVLLAFYIFIFQRGGGDHNPLHLHKNGMGGSMSCALIVCVEMWFAANDKKRKALLLLSTMITGAGLIFTLSRGGWLGAIVGLIAIFFLRRQFKLLAQLCILMIPVVAVCWSLLPQADREYATDFKRKQTNGGQNIEIRYHDADVALNYWKTNRIWGGGVGLRKDYDATNTALLLLAETGVVGLLSFTWVYVSFVGMAWKTQKALDRNDPRYSFLAAGSGLMLGHMAHGMVDHYWARGPANIAWSSAGMALGVYLSVRQQSSSRDLPAIVCDVPPRVTSGKSHPRVPET